MRRNYYVDFETALDLRWELIREKALDGYIFADDPQKMQWLPYGALLDLFDELNRSPMRCRPVYLEGVWGGFYVHKLRKLPKEMKNCAWVFDMIPMEVSLAATFDGNEFEVPFYTFVQAMGEKLLGKRAYDAFGGYFPIRFNYDDTYHANGNMSIQCHPDAEYVMKNHSRAGPSGRELLRLRHRAGRQDLSGLPKRGLLREVLRRRGKGAGDSTN